MKEFIKKVKRNRVPHAPYFFLLYVQVDVSSMKKNITSTHSFIKEFIFTTSNRFLIGPWTNI